MTLRVLALITLVTLTGCTEQSALPESRFQPADALVTQITANIETSASLTLIADIDHARLGAEVASVMGPARVLIFSDPVLESRIIALNALAALELPLRVLAYENPETGDARVIYNRYDYLASRYQLTGPKARALADDYAASFESALAGIGQAHLADFDENTMQPDGIITIESPYDFEQTLARVSAAIDAQDDTLHFGKVDFQANAAALGITLPPSHMILFGAPGPGGKAMASAPTLGLDGFCQKFLIWQAEDGRVRLSFNDLIALAKRQGADIALPLRVIDFRLKSVFEEALSPD